MFLAAILLAQAAAASAACYEPPPALFANGVEVLNVVRVVTGPDGESHFQDTTLRGSSHAFFSTGKVVQQNVLSSSAKVSLISGPGDQILPMHSGKAMLLELVGSSVVTVAGGEVRKVTPGTLVIFDDALSKSGHGGRTGRCGYVALSIAPQDPPPSATNPQHP